jgi:hypothetical protein
MSSVKYTLTDKDVSTIALAKWINMKTWGLAFSLSEALVIARSLKNGGSWEIDSTEVTPPNEKDPCLGVIQPEPEDDNAAFWKTIQLEIAHCENLLGRGAAGDIEAAIEYCKLELAGKVPHAAYAC